jgi:hypothetical protein
MDVNTAFAHSYTNGAMSGKSATEQTEQLTFDAGVSRFISVRPLRPLWLRPALQPAFLVGCVRLHLVQ